MKQVITATLTDAEIMAAVTQALFKAKGVKAVGPVAINIKSIPCLGGNLHNIVLEYDDQSVKPHADRLKITFDASEN